MKMKLPAEILWILNEFASVQEEVFLVGGCVRDMLLNKAHHDYDLTTSLKVEGVQELFKGKDCHIVPTGLKHGTVTIFKNSLAIEITTYRIDIDYENHRSPKQIMYTSNLEEDLKRRDFTMNAIAYHPSINLIDPYGGQKDIEDKVIRCVGNSDLRFKEDALRMLRALRFHCTLHFHIETQTLQAIKNNAGLLSAISNERIKDEFVKMLKSDKVNLLQFLRDTQMMSYLLPEIIKMYDFHQHSPWHQYDLLTHTDIALNYALSLTLPQRLALLFHDTGKVCAQTFEGNTAHYYGHALQSEHIARFALRRLKFDRKTIDHVCILIKYHDYRVRADEKILRRFLAKIDNSISLAIEILEIQRCDDAAKIKAKVANEMLAIDDSIELLHIMEKENRIITRSKLSINGYDLQNEGYQGKQIGARLKKAYEYIVEYPDKNNKEDLLTYLKNCE